jgi:hypothetical protein
MKPTKDKLQFILCVLTCVFFAIAFLASVTMGFTDAKMLLGKVVIGSLIAGAGCVLGLIGVLIPEMS